MLKKLMKYEWKETRTVGLIFLGVLVFAALLGVLSIQFTAWSITYESGNGNSGIMSLTSMFSAFFSFFIYTISLSGTIYGIMIYLAVRFYKTMYTDEGYLLHTLPVTKHQILISKIVIGAAWMGILYGVMILSFIIFMVSLASVLSSGSFFEILRQIPDYLAQMAEFMTSVIGSEWGFTALMTHYVVSILLLCLIGLPAQLINLYGAISLGQLFNKHRVLWAILFSVGIGFGQSLLAYVVSIFLMVGTTLGSMAVPGSETFPMHVYAFQWDANWIVSLIIAIVLYKVSHTILTRKLNMG